MTEAEEEPSERGAFLLEPASVGRPNRDWRELVDDEPHTIVHRSSPLSVVLWACRLCLYWVGWPLRAVQRGYAWQSPAVDSMQDVYVRRRDHDSHMRLITRALKGEAVQSAELFAAFQNFKDPDPTMSFSRSSMKAMFFFADVTKEGRELIEYLETSERLATDDAAEISFVALAEGIAAWRRQAVPLQTAPLTNQI
mmetsp:Transcript_66582/g.124249  ORF Transcript_66582/g.124249 Transcript_66582/m.124249 type:complete len:196 (+) Transcript_66582:66-653(+)